MDLYLVRHGITSWNIEGRYQGWTDIDLTPEGLSQAWKTAEYFAAYCRQQGIEFDALYCSPLLRARRTAGTISDRLCLPPQLWPELSEMNGGLIEGLTLHQWQAQYPALIEGWSDDENLEFSWPTGETRRQFMTRVRFAMDAIIAQHGPNDHVIVVTHGGVIESYLAQLDLADAEKYRPFNIMNCGITHLQISKAEGATEASVGCLLKFSDVRHLEASVDANSIW